MKLLFELSGEHPTLPFVELECVGRVIDRRTRVAVAECPDPAATNRLALTHTVMEYLGECEPTADALVALLDDLAIETDRPFAARVKVVDGSADHPPQLTLERLIGSHIRGPVSLKSPEIIFRAVISEDRCFFGRVLVGGLRSTYEERSPITRPFFHPGVMMPRMARAMVNLSLVMPGEVMYDPFCGTGGMLEEGRLVGARVFGSDVDLFMVRGAEQNVPPAGLLVADATALPVGDASVDAVVTDLPYGQSVCIKAESLNWLYEGSLTEIKRVLKDGRRAVVIAHRDIREIAGRHFTILQYHEQRVHKSLTRRVLVLEKDATD
ncbi:methyltransferase domain-containing protein [Methanofollis aquaemaris]|uniref:tRNA (guanine(10)-N(2))-dimethyltransferase n=1 Tax=Methanofollis aquaemaris TaxID=126734 RepID=A0A8A3S2Y2_9EURY|nr:methyltransferase domain-containing protein [Methanofollis aquaemaris]QSZ66229.1 methyltransferase domain-containing protein [Methanofollis aquaemaris]